MKSPRRLTPTDIVLARAVRLALDPSVDPDDAVSELRELDAEHPDALDQALRRLHRGLHERPSPAGERAASLLVQVIATRPAPLLGADDHHPEVFLASA